VNTAYPMPGCFFCDQQAAATLPPRDDVVRTDHWRVAHAFNSTLPGWLVLLPTRHVLSFTDLTPGAADEHGGLIRRLSAALHAVTGCVKTYLMQFSEAEGSPTCTSTSCHGCPTNLSTPVDRGRSSTSLTTRLSGFQRPNTTPLRSGCAQPSVTPARPLLGPLCQSPVAPNGVERSRAGQFGRAPRREQPSERASRHDATFGRS